MSNTKKSAPNLTKSIQDELNGLPTKSAKIRYLDKKGYSRGDISRVLKIRYQHVRNVLVTPVKSD